MGFFKPAPKIQVRSVYMKRDGYLRGGIRRFEYNATILTNYKERS